MLSQKNRLNIVKRLDFLSGSAKWQHSKITAYSNDDDLDTRASTFLHHLFGIDDAIIAISAGL